MLKLQYYYTQNKITLLNKIPIINLNHWPIFQTNQATHQWQPVWCQGIDVKLHMHTSWHIPAWRNLSLHVVTWMVCKIPQIAPANHEMILASLPQNTPPKCPDSWSI